VRPRFNNGWDIPGCNIDDAIAGHASTHFPGLSTKQIKDRIDDVRKNFQDSYDFGGGRKIYRKGNTILIEDGAGGGTIFQPDGSALDYFNKLLENG